MADYYAGSDDMQRAIADYDHALELSPNRPDVYDSLAVAYYKRGDRAAAVAQWKQAFAVLSKQLDSAHVPESFWADFGRTCDQLRARQLLLELKPDADAIVRTYLRHNGNYRSNALLQPAYAAIGDPASATAWLVDFSSAAPDPAQILADVADSLLDSARRNARRSISAFSQSKQDAVLGKLAGLERDNAQQDIDSWQVRWIEYLVRTKQFAQAADAIAALPQGTRDARAGALVPLDLRVACAARERSMPENCRISRRTTDHSRCRLLRSAARQLIRRRRQAIGAQNSRICFCS